MSEHAGLFDDRLGIGANQPPQEDAFAIRIDMLVDAANLWSRERQDILAEEDARRCADLLEQLIREREAVETERKRLKKPHDDAAAAVQARFKPLVDKVDACLKVIKLLNAKWLNHEEERLAREAEEKRQAEAKAKADLAEAERKKAAGEGGAVDNILAVDAAQQQIKTAAKETKQAARAKPQVQGEFAPRARGFRTEWSAEIVNAQQALVFLSDEPDILQALQKVGNRLAREHKNMMMVPGLRAKSEQVV